jgi:hypothetical protein
MIDYVSATSSGIQPIQKFSKEISLLLCFTYKLIKSSVLRIKVQRAYINCIKKRKFAWCALVTIVNQKFYYGARWQQFSQLSSYCAINRFPVMAPISAPILGEHFFRGRFSLKKWDDLPPFKPRFKLFQKHVSSYLTGSVLWPSYNSHLLGVHFFRGHISLKNWTICPLFSHDTSYFKNMCLLIYQNKRRLCCIGRTFTANRGNN